jgi:hypothetical protein
VYIHFTKVVAKYLFGEMGMHGYASIQVGAEKI